MTPNFAALVQEEARAPAFKAALRAADASELTEAMKYLKGIPGSDRKLGRLRAALRRRAAHDKK